MRDPTPSGAPKNVILIGFMGSGKTTVGRILARRMGWRLVDTDRMIEQRVHKSIPEIFEEQGEAGFRQLETAEARRLSRRRNCVIATGGGFPIDPQNLQAARQAGEVFFLVASLDSIWHRVRNSAHRPLLKGADPQGRIRELLEQRMPVYRSATKHHIATDHRRPEEVADEIFSKLKLG